MGVKNRVRIGANEQLTLITTIVNVAKSCK